MKPLEEVCDVQYHHQYVDDTQLYLLTLDWQNEALEYLKTTQALLWKN